MRIAKPRKTLYCPYIPLWKNCSAVSGNTVPPRFFSLQTASSQISSFDLLPRPSDLWNSTKRWRHLTHFHSSSLSDSFDQIENVAETKVAHGWPVGKNDLGGGKFSFPSAPTILNLRSLESPRKIRIEGRTWHPRFIARLLLSIWSVRFISVSGETGYVQQGRIKFPRGK